MNKRSVTNDERLNPALCAKTRKTNRYDKFTKYQLHSPPLQNRQIRAGRSRPGAARVLRGRARASGTALPAMRQFADTRWQYVDVPRVCHGRADLQLEWHSLGVRGALGH